MIDRAHFANTMFGYVNSIIDDANRRGESQRVESLQKFTSEYLNLDTHDNFVCGCETPLNFTLRIIQGFAMVEVRTWRGSNNRPKGERLVPAEVYDDLLNMMKELPYETDINEQYEHL